MSANINVAALMPENDRNFMRSIGIATLFGLLASWSLAQIEFIIAPIFIDPIETVHAAQVRMQMAPPVEKKIPQQKKPVLSKNHDSGKTAKARGRGVPRAIAQTSVIAMVIARTHRLNQDAYTVMNKQVHRDLDKVLQSTARLVTHGQTTIGGRPGKVSGIFDDGYAAGDAGGLDDVLASITKGGGSGRIDTKSYVSRIIPKASEISLGQGSTSRSLNEVLQVVRSRTPGLRHIYNKYLKLHVGFNGKVTLLFTILPGGDIADCHIASSTTGLDDFDEDIRAAVLTWHFKTIPAGNTTITIPFQFSE